MKDLSMLGGEERSAAERVARERIALESGGVGGTARAAAEAAFRRLRRRQAFPRDPPRRRPRSSRPFPESFKDDWGANGVTHEKAVFEEVR